MYGFAPLTAIRKNNLDRTCAGENLMLRRIGNYPIECSQSYYSQRPGTSIHTQAYTRTPHYGTWALDTPYGCNLLWFLFFTGCSQGETLFTTLLQVLIHIYEDSGSMISLRLPLRDFQIFSYHPSFPSFPLLFWISQTRGGRRWMMFFPHVLAKIGPVIIGMFLSELS